MFSKGSPWQFICIHWKQDLNQLRLFEVFIPVYGLYSNSVDVKNLGNILSPCRTTLVDGIAGV